LDTKISNESGIKDAAVQPSEQAPQQANEQAPQQASEKSEKKKSTIRCALYQPERNVLEFLRKCKAYQADAVRVIADFAVSGQNVKEFSPEAATFINAFLNDSASNDRIKDVQSMKSHREERAEELMDLAENYFVNSEIRRVMRAMSKLASDEVHAKNAYDSLTKSFAKY
jgi:leucyl-tRNA synthetase